MACTRSASCAHHNCSDSTRPISVMGLSEFKVRIGNTGMQPAEINKLIGSHPHYGKRVYREAAQLFIDARTPKVDVAGPDATEPQRDAMAVPTLPVPRSEADDVTRGYAVLANPARRRVA